MPHKLKKRRQKDPWPPVHSAKRPREIELIRKAVRNTPEHEKPKFDPDNRPPGFTTSTFTISFNNKPKEEAEISLKDWEPNIPVSPPQQADTQAATEQQEEIDVDDAEIMQMNLIIRWPIAIR